MKKYNIYIVNSNTQEARKKFTSNVSENEMYKALVQCMRSINHLFEAVEVEVGTRIDKEYEMQLK